MLESTSTLSSESGVFHDQTPFSIADLFSSNQKQIEAWNAQASKRFLLYGGAAGGGKSFFLRWWAVAYLIDLAQQGITGAPVGLFCEDYPSLKDRQISRIEMEFPPSLGKLKQGETRDFILNREWGGGRILLRNLDDPSKYLSSEFAGIGVDELTKNELGMFNFLRMRLRWPGVARPRFVGTTNPGGKGHGWVKKYWLGKEFPEEMQEIASEFVFVQAKAQDNPFLTESYYKDLKTLPPAMAKAYAEGNWDIFAGQYFDIFNQERHCKRPEDMGIEPWWTRWVSIDWGFEHPSAVYWHAMSPDRRVVTYRELVQNRLTPRELGAVVREANGKDKITDVYLSPDAFAKRTSEHTIAEELGDVLAEAGLPRPERADDDRVGGWMLMYQMLQTGAWQIGTNCAKLIDCLPILTRDEKHVEDVLKVDGDDAADSVRYGLKTRLQPGRKPVELRVAERIHTTDPTSTMIWQQKFTQQEQRGTMVRPRRWGPGFRRN